MAAKPPAVRLLEQRGIAFVLHAFDEAIRSAEDVALAAGLPADLVFKTLVVETVPGGRPALVMSPAGHDVDLRKVAAVAGVKRARMASHRDAERLTGLQVGGISALALAGRRWLTVLDASALRHDRILVSAGIRGMDIELAAADLIELTAARTADIARDGPASPPS